MLNEEGEVLIEGMIVDDSNLYVVDPAYFVKNVEALHTDIATESDKASVPFAGMADVVDVVEESLEEQYEKQNWEWWYRLHAIPVLRDVDPIHQVRRVA